MTAPTPMGAPAPLRTRFAPSPTGSLHIGGVRTALYCALLARRTGGAFLLRIEDTDRARSTEEATEGIVRDLEWVGLPWDEGPVVGGPHEPYLCSQRLPLYDEAVERLLAQGDAYLAWETTEELAALRDRARDAKEDFHYRKHLHQPNGYTDADIARFRAEGRVPAVRVRCPDRRIVVHDLVLGEVVLEAEKQDDFVIRKADGFPTYHLAVVVDDHEMGIDLILRGQEHLMNTHKHRILFELLGWEPIVTAHLPLIFNPGGSKMSKRDKAKAAREAARAPIQQQGIEAVAASAGLDPEGLRLFMAKKHDSVSTAEALAARFQVELPLIEVQDFRRAGVVPEALINYLTLLGWSPGDDREIMSPEESAAVFSVERITKTPARFDETKLRWMCGEYLKRLDLDTLAAHLDDHLAVVPGSVLNRATPALRRQLLQLYRERVSTFSELAVAARYVFERPAAWDPQAVAKHLAKGDGFRHLRGVAEHLSGVDDWTAPALEAATASHCESEGIGLGKVAQPLRIAVTGTAVSPPIFDVLALLGREETLARVARCLEAHGA